MSKAGERLIEAAQEAAVPPRKVGEPFQWNGKAWLRLKSGQIVCLNLPSPSQQQGE